MEKTVLCFGDSNTHGYNAADGGRFPYEQRWTGVLSGLMGPDWRVIEEGLSGRTTAFDDPLHEGMNSLPVIAPIMLSHEPLDATIVMLGTNDTKERFGCSAPALGVTMARLLDRIITIPAWRDGKANIIVVAPSPMQPGYYDLTSGLAMGKGCSEKSFGLAEQYRAVAQQRGCRFLDAGPLAPVHPCDLTHLTAEGHAALAAALAKLLRGEPQTAHL